MTTLIINLAQEGCDGCMCKFYEFEKQDYSTCDNYSELEIIPQLIYLCVNVVYVQCFFKLILIMRV